MKFKRKRLLDLYKTLNKIKGQKDKTFGLYILINEKRLITIIQEIDEMRKISFATERIQQLQQQELDILLKYVEKDENDKPIMFSANQYKILEDKREDYKKESQNFYEINKFELEDYQSQVNHVNELLEEEIEVDLLEIPFEVVPKEMDLRDELAILFDLLKKDSLPVANPTPTGT